MLNELIKFLGQHGVTDIGFIDEKAAEGMFASPNKNFVWTQFRATDDSLLYSNLIAQLIRITPGEITLLDLGAGSSVPTIRAILESNSSDRVNVVAVERSLSAIEIGKVNVSKLGLNNHYRFVNQDMFGFISSYDFGKDTVVVSNPPYLPVPEGFKDDIYEVICGGVDGAKYLETILLNPDIPSGTVIVLQWSSLSNPVKVVEIINRQYKVLFISAFRTPFGTYTGSSPLKEHLSEQREKGLSLFSNEKDGSHQYLFVGTILKKK